jgi:SAM-dependent methyltransferase
VLEFGCNAGKNLIALLRKQPTVFASGVDINSAAIEFGRNHSNLRLSCGDETVLDIIPDQAFDVVFTVSVLDHLPEPGAVVANLARISRKAVLLLELYTGQEGRVVRNTERRTGKWIDTTPYSYSWDYPRLFSEGLPDWPFEARDVPIDSNLGRFYKLYRLMRPSAVAGL